MNKQVIGMVALALAGLLAGCGGGGTDAKIEIGRRIYNNGGASSVPCATCHTLDGTTLVGPSFQGIKDTAGTRVAGLSAEDYLRESITDPEAYIVEGYSGQMYREYAKVLSDEEIDGLITFLLAQ